MKVKYEIRNSMKETRGTTAQVVADKLAKYPKEVDSSKLKEFADENFKVDENGRKFYKRIEKNLVGKGKIARYEQFLLFTQCFQKTCTEDT